MTVYVLIVDGVVKGVFSRKQDPEALLKNLYPTGQIEAHRVDAVLPD